LPPSINKQRKKRQHVLGLAQLKDELKRPKEDRIQWTTLFSEECKRPAENEKAQKIPEKEQRNSHKTNKSRKRNQNDKHEQKLQKLDVHPLMSKLVVANASKDIAAAWKHLEELKYNIDSVLVSSIGPGILRTVIQTTKKNFTDGHLKGLCNALLAKIRLISDELDSSGSISSSMTKHGETSQTATTANSTTLPPPATTATRETVISSSVVSTIAHTIPATTNSSTAGAAVSGTAPLPPQPPTSYNAISSNNGSSPPGGGGPPLQYFTPSLPSPPPPRRPQLYNAYPPTLQQSYSNSGG